MIISKDANNSLDTPETNTVLLLNYAPTQNNFFFRKNFGFDVDKNHYQFNIKILNKVSTEGTYFIIQAIYDKATAT